MVAVILHTQMVLPAAVSRAVMQELAFVVLACLVGVAAIVFGSIALRAVPRVSTRLIAGVVVAAWLLTVASTVGHAYIYYDLKEYCASIYGWFDPTCYGL